MSTVAVRKLWLGRAVAVVAAGSLGAGVLVVPVALATPALAEAAAAAPPVAKDVTERPDLYSASVAARTQGHRVLVSSLSTDRSSTFVNADGTQTQEVATRPVHVWRAGAWVDVDPALVRDGAGLHPRAVPVTTSLSTGGSASLVTSDLGLGRLLKTGWGSSLPAPSVSGDTATYPNVLPNADLTVQTSAVGYEFNLIVKQRPTASLSTVKVPLALTGLTPTLVGGDVQFRDAKGVLVAQFLPPVMTDSSGAGADGVVGRSRPIGMSLSGSTLTLTIDTAFLADPQTVYPVVIDPVLSYGVGTDTYIQASNPTTNFNSSAALQTGSTNGGADRSRTLLSFNTGGVAGKHIVSATLGLWNYAAGACYTGTASSDPLNMYVITQPWSASTVTWNTNPLPSSTVSGTLHQSRNNGTGCPAGTINTDVTGAVAAWAAGTANYGLELYAANDGLPAGYRNFYSSAHAAPPSLSVTYNSVPSAPVGRSVTPCAASCSGQPVTTSPFPALTANATDADGGTLTYTYEVYAGSNPSPTSAMLVVSGSGSAVTAGSTDSWTVPLSSYLNDGTYEYRVRAFDGIDSGPWSSGYTVFTVDHTPPADPTVSSASWPKDQWSSGPTSSSGTLSWSGSDATVSQYQYWLDSASPTTVGASTTSVTLSGLAMGWHTFHLQALDAYANTSGRFDYSFGVGVGSLSSPADLDRTQQNTRLAADPANPSYTYVRYDWVPGNSTAGWHTIAPTSLMNPVDGSRPTSNANDTYSLAAFPALTWQTTQDVGYDGLVQVRACFAVDASTPANLCTSSHSLQITRTAFGASFDTQPVGPGSLSTLTGDLQVTATDASLSTFGGPLSVSRTATTLAPTATATGFGGVFGPGWTASLPDPGSGRVDETLSDHTSQGYVQLVGSDGSQEIYVPATAGSTTTYTGMADAADGSVLTKAGSIFTMKDTDGATTTWDSKSSSTPVLMSGVTPAGVNSPYYAYTGTQLTSVSQSPTTIDCGHAVVPNPPNPLGTLGCRSLKFLYGGPSNNLDNSLQEPTGMFDVSGRLAEIDAVVENSSGAMSITPIARYGYDSTNASTARLAGVWDPRISPKLVTSYSYVTGLNRLQTVKPAGLNAWTINYDSKARVANVARYDDALGKDAVTTVVYGVPWSGADANNAGLPDLSATTAAVWGQTSLVSIATAVFPPDSVPASPPTPADWQHADISYLDVNGRRTNSASYGGGDWQYGATNYDTHGNVTFDLTADNRAQVKVPTSSTDLAAAGMSSPQRAAVLATTSTYSADGADLLETLGPVHPVALAAGGTIDGRTHTVTSYDQGNPTGSATHLPTTQVTSVQSLPGVDADSHTTVTSYDPLVAGDGSGWDLRQPTAVTTVTPGGNRTHWTRFDTTGRVLETRLPAGTADATGRGNDTHSTVTTYYGTGAPGTCGGGNLALAYAGLPCTTGPYVQPPAGGQPTLPTSKVTAYTLWAQPITTQELDTTSTVLRTTGTTYDPAGRPIATSVVTNTADPTLHTTASVVPDTTMTYSPSTGLPLTTSSAAGTLTTGYDNQGRTVSYTDANNNTSTTIYDLNGRVATRTDGKATYTYTYDGTAGEHRGMLTTLNTGITAAGYTSNTSYTVPSYDPDGRPVSTVLPNGDTSTNVWDNAGEQTSLAYAGNGLGGGLVFTAGYDSLGRKTTLSGPNTSQAFSYTLVGELATATRTTAGSGTCVTAQAFGYDLDSNRTGYGTAAGTCTAPSTALVHSYDNADRLIDTGTVYDKLGRTTTTPASTVTGGAALNVHYYENDMVQSQDQTAGTTHTQTFTLDPSQHRIVSQTDSSNGTSTNYYSDDSDSPAWTANPTGWTRNIDGLAGLGAIQTHTNTTDTITLQLTDLQGNVAATVDDTTNALVSACYDYDPFGASVGTAPAPSKYGWLGNHQRAADDLASLTLMGQRLYNPTTGRFLSIDPIPGGSANNYDYVNQDPINASDLDGRWPRFHCGWCQKVRRAGGSFGRGIYAHSGDIALGLSFAAVIATGGAATPLLIAAASFSAVSSARHFSRGEYADGAMDSIGAFAGAGEGAFKLGARAARLGRSARSARLASRLHRGAETMNRLGASATFSSAYVSAVHSHWYRSEMA